MDVSEETMTCQFSNIGVQCVTKRQIEASLQIRKRIQVDPFGLGFDHKNSDRTTVRLCFQVFLKPKEGGLVPLLPVVSHLIKDKRAHPDLNIVDISDDTSPVKGGKKILLFCSKIKKEDIEVIFLHYGKNGEEILTTKGEFGEANVHDQSGISFKTPPYPDLEITEPAKVSICLRQPSKKMQSEPQDFWYLPNDSKIAARNESIGNDLKQKILMIQRIAEEAKLHDFDIKKEEVDRTVPANGILTPPPSSSSESFTSSDLPNVDRLRKSNNSTPEKLTDTSSRTMSPKPKTATIGEKLRKLKGARAVNDKPPQVKSRFPLTGSYGGIININSDHRETEKQQDNPMEDSGFTEPSSINIISKPAEPEKPIINKRAAINTFLQQEQQHLANCVRLIAADMEEFETEPKSATKPLPSPIPMSFPNLNPHGCMIPNQEVFRGTCADEHFGLNGSPISGKGVISFPSQPLDLSSLSTSVVLPSQLSKSQVKKLQNQDGKEKRKRVRKPTESISINIMPMTPLPHQTKEDGDGNEIAKTVSRTSTQITGTINTLTNTTPETSTNVPKKRKKNIKTKKNHSASQMTQSRRKSADASRNSPSNTPITNGVVTSPNNTLSMPIIADAMVVKTEKPEYVRNDSDLEVGLIIDTDGEED
jgi:hypothetical protein